MPFTKEEEFEEQMYHCNHCGTAYFLEEEAEECEQDHSYQMNGYPWELAEEEGN